LSEGKRGGTGEEELGNRGAWMGKQIGLWSGVGRVGIMWGSCREGGPEVRDAPDMQVPPVWGRERERTGTDSRSGWAVLVGPDWAAPV
jgi:hypothetical protein